MGEDAVSVRQTRGRDVLMEWSGDEEVWLRVKLVTFECLYR